VIDFNYTVPVNADGKVSVLIPVELLWTEDYIFLGKNIENSTPEWHDLNALWAAKSLLRLKPHSDLYSALMDGQRSAASYTRWYQDIFAFRQMPCPFEPGPLLDVRAASAAFFAEEIERRGLNSPAMQITTKYNADRNVFIIDDGHHRATYMRMRGFRRIPALISYEDWKSWLNLPYGYHVNQVIAQQRRELIHTPVLTPMIHPMRVVRDNQYRSRLDHLMAFLGDRVLSGKLLDIGSNTGFFSFHFLREGMAVTGCELDEDHHSIANSLGDLYRLPHRFILGPAQDFLEQETDFTGCLLLTVLYHLIKNEQHKRLLKLIDQGVSDFIIWESGDDPQMEKELITSSTKFRNYSRISMTQATGKTREFGVFYIDGWLER
jgi:SAM-dependent methyltransferase